MYLSNMKANYLSKNNYRQYRSKRLQKILGIFLCTILIFVLYQIRAVSLIKNAFASARILFHDKSRLIEENTELKAQVASLETKALLLENSLVSQHEGKNMSTGRVLSRP